MITVSPSTIVRRPVWWCGRAALSGPAGDDRVVARPVGAEAAHAVLELVAHVGLGRLVGRAAAPPSSSAASAIAAASAMRASSPASLTRRSPVIVPASGRRSRSRARSVHAAWVRWSASAEHRAACRRRRTTWSRISARVVPTTTSTPRVEPGGGQVGGGPLGVAAVGDERAAGPARRRPSPASRRTTSASGCSTASTRRAWRRRGAARTASGRAA